MRIAVVGAGIAGLTAARELGREHDVHLFEAARTAGGHAHTVEVEEAGRRFPVDMGFIVYNERTYPTFIEMLDELEVETVASSMGFSVSERETGIEYSGEGWTSLLAAPRNALHLDFWQTMRDFVRFCRVGSEALESGIAGTIGSFCTQFGLSEAFRRLFLRPMAGAIWSTPTGKVDDFPAQPLLRFFDRHGLLSVIDRPVWRTIAGGSRRYVDAVLDELGRDQVHLGHAVERIERDENGVRLSVSGAEARFDELVLAVHSDRALSLLAAPTMAEREVLGAISYRRNEAVLHDDISVLPRGRRAWASWNVTVDDEEHESIGVTYLMNKLQPLPTATPWCVTLNRSDSIDPDRIRERVDFAHPQFDQAAIEAQTRWDEISGAERVHFCGAYWRYGFHEDGAWSGRRAARSVGHLRRQVA